MTASTIEVLLADVHVLKGYPVEPDTPERFAVIYKSVQGLWPGAVIQYERPKKEKK